MKELWRGPVGPSTVVVLCSVGTFSWSPGWLTKSTDAFKDDEVRVGICGSVFNCMPDREESEDADIKIGVSLFSFFSLFSLLGTWVSTKVG